MAAPNSNTGRAGRAIDAALDHILKSRKRAARVESEHAATEWALMYVLGLLDTFADASLSDRLRVVAEVRSLCAHLGIDGQDSTVSPVRVSPDAADSSVSAVSRLPEVDERVRP